MRVRMKVAIFVGAMMSTIAMAAPPQRVTIQYEMSRNGSAMAEVSETLQHDGRTFRARASMR